MKLYPFQVESVARSLEILGEHQFVYNTSEAGVGKTIMAIGLLKKLQPKKIVILCPASVKYQWKSELLKFTKLTEDQIAVYDKGVEQSVVTIFSYDAFSRYKDKLQIPSVLICDEGHFLKGSSTKRWKSVLPLIYAVKREGGNVLWLSATPMPNRPEEVFTALVAAELLSSSDYYDYVYKFCNARKVNRYGRSYLDTSGASNVSELRDIMSRISVRYEKLKVLNDLPSKTVSYTQVDVGRLPKAVQKALDYEVESVEDLHDITEDEHLATARRLLGLAKVESSVAFIKESLPKSGVLVFYYHEDVGAELESKLSAESKESGSRRVGRISGSVPAKKRSELQEAFQSGELEVLLLQIIAGGTGLNLQTATDVVFVETTWVPSDITQAVARAWRNGQKNPVVVNFLHSKHKLDASVSAVLASKQTLIEEIIK